MSVGMPLQLLPHNPALAVLFGGSGTYLLPPRQPARQSAGWVNTAAGPCLNRYAAIVNDGRSERHRMPELGRFRGMVIGMYYEDEGQHNKPHVHVRYGDYKASLSLDGDILAGSLPRKQYRMVSGWLTTHEDEVYAAWSDAVRGIAFTRIEGE